MWDLVFGSTCAHNLNNHLATASQFLQTFPHLETKIKYRRATQEGADGLVDTSGRFCKR